MTVAEPKELVLALYPFVRGLAFVFFEGPESPFEWGVKAIKEKDKNRKTLEVVQKLIDQYRPEVLVIEDTSERGSRRTSRIRKLYRMLAHIADAEYVDVSRCTKKEIQACFKPVGASTKYEIAKAIALQIPAFAHRMPRFRKPWMDEDPRQSFFDAAALGLTYYAWHKRSPYQNNLIA